jgi:arylsulfatase A-like enzyme
MSATGSDREAPAEPPGGLLVTLRAALNAGLAAGLVFGLLDGVVALVRTAPGGLVTSLGCLAGAVVFYGIAGAGILLLLAPLAHPWLKDRDLEGRLYGVFGLAVGIGLFCELYWWTRVWLFYGIPATDPRRLAAAAVLLLLGLGLGLLAGRRARALPFGARAAMSYAVPLLWIGGVAFLYASHGQAARAGKPTARTASLPNVLLFVVDALRADALGCYGNERIRTPVIDGLAERGVVFENAFVQAPFTWTSFGSFLTGKYPRRHGLVLMKAGARMAPNVTLPWHLKSARFASSEEHLEPTDFASATFMTGTLSQGSGLMRGFDAYYEAMAGHELVNTASPWSVFRSELLLFLFKNKLGQRFDDAPVATQARAWLLEHRARRFLSMVHFYSTHTPYDPPRRFREMYVDPDYDGPVHAFYAKHRQAIERGDAVPTEADVRRIRDLYAAGVTQADAMIGEVLEALAEGGVLENTIVIVTADHGEELGDHGLWEHNFMYQTNLRVPLVMALPERYRVAPGTRVEALVESVDLLPTLCDLLGLAVPHEEGAGDERGREYGRVDGVSLLPLMRGEVESVKEFSFAENGRFLSIQDREWKLIVRPEALEPEAWTAALEAGERPRLFHLAQDPDEHANVFGEHPGPVERLLAALREWDAGMPIPRHEVVESDRDVEHRLHELGYVEGVGQGVPDSPRSTGASEGGRAPGSGAGGPAVGQGSGDPEEPQLRDER